MGLSGSQSKQLQEALLDAFRDKVSLKQMLWFQLDKKLDVIAGGNNLQAIVFTLIEKADAENWVENLIFAAIEANPENSRLKDIAEQVSPQKQRKNQINNLLQQGRKIAPISSPVQEAIKIDRGVIINYDLDKMIGIFKQTVKYEGSFVFDVTGHHHEILRDYFIERIQNAFKEKTGRDHQRLQIYLRRENLKSIESEFLDTYRHFQCWIDLFNNQSNPDIQHHPDIMLIIWNLYASKSIIKSLAEEFLTTISASVDRYVKGESRCFVLLWVNVGKQRSLTGFTALQTPKEFDLKELSFWFRNHLSVVGIEKNKIESYLYKLESPRGDLILTYQAMKEIIQELQGSSHLYG